MERIKNIKDIIIGDAEVLLELVKPERKSGLITKENLENKVTNHYGVVVAKGALVTDLEIGDIAVRTRIKEAPSYEYRGKELLLFNRYSIAIAVKPVNFDLTEELSA